MLHLAVIHRAMVLHVMVANIHIVLLARSRASLRRMRLFPTLHGFRIMCVLCIGASTAASIVTSPAFSKPKVNSNPQPTGFIFFTSCRETNGPRSQPHARMRRDDEGAVGLTRLGSTLSGCLLTSMRVEIDLNKGLGRHQRDLRTQLRDASIIS
jgi:hypothetical protein